MKAAKNGACCDGAEALDRSVEWRIGRGLSQGGSELDYSLDAYAADVVAFASALRFDRFMLGHWMTEVSSQVCNHSARITEVLIRPFRRPVAQRFKIGPFSREPHHDPVGQL
jgi:hypothetical protein